MYPIIIANNTLASFIIPFPKWVKPKDKIKVIPPTSQFCQAPHPATSTLPAPPIFVIAIG